MTNKFRKCHEPHLRDYPDCFEECGCDVCEAPLFSESVKRQEDKEAIETVAKFLGEQYHPHQEFNTLSNGVKADLLCFGGEILQTLASLGYVKLAEQKLPENPYQDRPSPPIILYDVERYAQAELDMKIAIAYSATDKAQQDMLSVDSEGCAYRRVYVGDHYIDPDLIDGKEDK